MKCRICKTDNCYDVIRLGNQKITSRFPDINEPETLYSDMTLFQCNDCGLVQLKDLVLQSDLYEHTYGYRSGINEMMQSHLRDYNSEIQSKISLRSGDFVLDIGSNDSTFLSFYPSYLKRVGCDPTGSQFASYYSSDMSLVPDYFSKKAVESISRKFKVVSSISMFYDLPDPVEFANDVFSVLDDDGIWTFEQSYIVEMLKNNSFDTICHEHIEYYALRQIKIILNKANMKIIHISENSCNGGSIRIYAAKNDSQHYEECVDIITGYINRENEYGLNCASTYTDFMSRCDVQMKNLKEFLNVHPNTYIYGASTKGNCLLQYANITLSDIPFAVERNKDKVGKTTSTGIPIISEEQMRESPPEFLLILPWHFKEQIIKRENLFLENGGKLVFPLPEFQVISKNN